VTALLLGLLRLYRRWLSPLLPPACRYTPSCSQYAEDALRVHGFVPGLALIVRRLARCHPWGGEGHDPVPPRPIRKEA
jgi:putative membrane protein insertion efficiency factor